MHTSYPPCPSYPPRPGVVRGVTDENLAAQLRGGPESEAGDPVAVLMTRHWQSAHDYAVICLATSANVASMVTAASFHRVLDKLLRGESGIALRPRLLVTVRDMVREWAADDSLAGVLPDLGKPAGGRGMRAAKSMTLENRKLAERSFKALPPIAQCLLWHTEVEAEPIAIPAGLSGMGPDTAAVALEQAREQFRQGCVRAHRELAPTSNCRFYNRLLDVPIRRGGALLPDVQQHLLECPYCRHAAEQLSHFEGPLGGLLAEAVLGWGARRYLDSRPYRSPQGGSGQAGGQRGARGGRHGLLSQVPPQRRATGASGPRGGRTLLTGVSAAAGGVLLALVLCVALLSDDGTGADPTASTSATGDRSTGVAPGPEGTPAPTSSPPPGSAGLPKAADQTRLRNLAADLCLDLRGGKAKNGAATRLAECSSAWTQKWSYEVNGQLRSVANPELCLDSRVDAGVVVLGKCATGKSSRAVDVRYDLTVQGELLPRWADELAIAPTGTDLDADIAVKARDGSDAQRWVTDGTSATPESRSVAGSGAPPTDLAATPLADGAPEPEQTGGPAPETLPEGTTRSVTYTDLDTGRSVLTGDDASEVRSLSLTPPRALSHPGSDPLA